jgi:DNA-binding NarL/FixJ family response regulator
MSRSVLLIDDEPAVLSGLRRVLALHRREWNVLTAPSGEEGLRLLDSAKIDALVSDMSMPGMHGLDVLKYVSANHPRVLRVALTGFVDEEWKVKNSGLAQVFLAKPCHPDDLVAAIEHPDNLGWTAKPSRPTQGVGEERHIAPPRPSPVRWRDEDEVTFQ